MGVGFRTLNSPPSLAPLLIVTPSRQHRGGDHRSVLCRPRNDRLRFGAVGLLPIHYARCRPPLPSAHLTNSKAEYMLRSGVAPVGDLVGPDPLLQSQPPRGESAYGEEKSSTPLGQDYLGRLKQSHRTNAGPRPQHMNEAVVGPVIGGAFAIIGVLIGVASAMWVSRRELEATR
jgi:hypothetical protein